MDDALMTALESYEVSFVLMHAQATPAPKRPNKRPKLMPPTDAAPIKWVKERFRVRERLKTSLLLLCQPHTATAMEHPLHEQRLGNPLRSTKRLKMFPASASQAGCAPNQADASKQPRSSQELVGPYPCLHTRKRAIVHVVENP